MAKLLMISTDRKIFEAGSAVRERMAEYAKHWQEMHIIVFAKTAVTAASTASTASATSAGASSSTSPSSAASTVAGETSVERGEAECETLRLSEEGEAGVSTSRPRPLDDRSVSPSAASRLRETLLSSAGGAVAITIAPNCWAYSTESLFQMLYSFDAIRLGRFIVTRRGITHITCQDPFLTATAGISLKKQFKNKVELELQLHTDIASPHFSHSVLNGVRKMMALSYLPRADKIRVVSKRQKDYLVERLKIEESKITVRPIVVDVDWIKNAPVSVDLHRKYPQFDKIVLMASRFEREKNIGLAIDSWQEVVKRMPKAGLVVTGLGSQGPRLRALVAKSGLKDAIKFESWVSGQTLASYYKTADAFLSTSLYEGYGMTFIEARAAGCPIVSTDVGVAREMGAMIVPFDCQAEVAKGIVGMLRKGKRENVKM